MSLTERINERRQPNERIVPIVERRRPEPVWLQRMKRQGLPVVDHTFDVKVAA